MFTILFEHLVWADAEVRTEIAAMAQHSPERERAEAIYAHLAAVEHNWFGRLQGGSPAVGLWPALDVAAAGALAEETGQAYREYVATLGPADLGRVVNYRNTSGQAFSSRVDEILTHVALHGSYHRGQLALLARQGGVQPAMTEYIGYLRMRPASAAPAPSER
jgi:uncharacterized damage-inducible protein DinB